MDAAQANIVGPAAHATGLGTDHILAATTVLIETPIAGTAARPATGADRGAIAAIRLITGVYPMAHGSSEAVAAAQLVTNHVARAAKSRVRSCTLSSSLI